jgi:N-acetylglucosamine-6-sulfatase
MTTAVITALSPAAARATAAPDGLPNIVLIVTDDQRWDTLAAMDQLQAELIPTGTNFTQAHAVLPLCCPARASILTGRYAHSTGVYTNVAPNGGFEGFDPSETLATVLDDAGYRTALIGKYLNQYPLGGPTPPGWDRWVALTDADGSYYDYDLTEDARIVHYGHAPQDYLTDVLIEKALNFIRASARPFFLYWTPLAPHHQAEPEHEYLPTFDSLEPWRPPSYNEVDVSDKPLWMQRTQPLTPDEVAAIDDFRQRQYQTLQTVDDGVAAIRALLAQQRELQDTIFVYTSDNGYLWGEHRLKGKNLPYEESTRVPMVVAWSGWVPRGESAELATHIDIAPTLAAAAGTVMPGADGEDLSGYLSGEKNVIRSAHLIEDVAHKRAPAWCQLRTRNLAYTYYAPQNGRPADEELYNVRVDPHQLTNIAGRRTPSFMEGLREMLRGLCDPLPAGMPPF